MLEDVDSSGSLKDGYCVDPFGILLHLIMVR